MTLGARSWSAWRSSRRYSLTVSPSVYKRETDMARRPVSQQASAATRGKKTEHYSAEKNACARPPTRCVRALARTRTRGAGKRHAADLVKVELEEGGAVCEGQAVVAACSEEVGYQPLSAQHPHALLPVPIIIQTRVVRIHLVLVVVQRDNPLRVRSNVDLPCKQDRTGACRYSVSGMCLVPPLPFELTRRSAHFCQQLSQAQKLAKDRTVPYSVSRDVPGLDVP